MPLVSLPALRQVVQQTQLRGIVRKLNFEKPTQAQKYGWLDEALDLIEQPHLLPMNISFQKEWVDAGQSLLAQAFSVQETPRYLSQIGWARILRMGSEGIRPMFHACQEREVFLLDQRLNDSLQHYKQIQKHAILRAVTLQDFFPALAHALERGHFSPFLPMPQSEDLIQEDKQRGPTFSWRAMAQHSLLGYVAIHTPHARYLRAFLKQGGNADDILIEDAMLPQYQLTFLQHICQDVLAMAVGRPLYTIQHRVLPLSCFDKARLALDLGANMYYAYGDRPSPWEWVHGALRYPDLKHRQPLEELLDIFESHQLRQNLKQRATLIDTHERDTKRL